MARVIVLAAAHHVVHGVVQFRISVLQNVEVVAQAEQLVVVDAAETQVAEIVVGRIVLLVQVVVVL